MSEKSIKAEELLAELEDDPTYQQRRAELDGQIAKLAAECASDEKDLVQEIRALGYDIESVYDFVNNSPHPFLERRFVGPYSKAYATLVSHLKKPHHPRIREGIVRCLTVKDGGKLVEEALIEEFRFETDTNLRWVFANALRTAMPSHSQQNYPEIDEVFKAQKSV